MGKKLVASLALCAIVAGAVATLVLRGGSSPTTPLFVDESASSGISQVYDGEFEHFVGGGVASFDCNDDGYPDLYFAGGTNVAALYVNRSNAGGELRFERRASQVTDLVAVTGAYPLDVDGDRVLDLVVLRRGGNALLRGLGDCSFEDASTTWGVDPGDDWTVAFSATWERGESLPTLAFGNYLIPDTYDCARNVVWRPNESTYGPPLELPGHCTLSLLYSDWNRDGGVDLRVSNDRNYDREAREQLWRFRPGEVPREYGESDGWRTVTIWGMGIASYDVTGDGKPELYLTSQADNKLQTLEPDSDTPTYRDIALERGVTAQRPYLGEEILPSTAWHPEFDDVNNDGVIDLFVSKGNVDAQIDYAAFDPNNLLLGTRDGTFVERGSQAGLANGARSRGAAVVDLNLDGLLDLVVVDRRVPVEVYRNVGKGTATSPLAMGNWIGVRLRQDSSNTMGVGAQVEVRANGKIMTREVTVGGGHASGDASWLHFGLGNATTVELRVTFPGAEPSAWSTVDANAFYELSRGEASPRMWQPG